MATSKIAIIGGSGISDSPAFEGLEWKLFDTGISNGVRDGIVAYQESDDGIIFIPRHGHGKKKYGPSNTQYAANIVTAKMLGANAIIAASAVGSLKSDRIEIGSLVIPDDYVDDSGRADTLIPTGIVIHLSPRPAFSQELSKILYEEAAGKGYFSGVYKRATYVTIPGDRFGTAAEGKRRSQYADIVGMTLCPEVSMAMQAGMQYAVACFVVDVDSNANHEGQTLEVMRKLSHSEKVPAYISKVVQRAKQISFPQLSQLKGNIIPGDLNRINNEYLRKIADEVVKQYC
jgi:5'-methylthioadenosine phosphorylase